MSVDAIADTGLLDGLSDAERGERAELIEWLLAQGFNVEQIRAEVAPLMLPAHRALGNDGDYVSAREISEVHRIDTEQLQRIVRALGLPRVDDPEAVALLRADAEAAVHQQRLVDVGLDPDQVALLIRRLTEGLSRAVPAFRYSTMSAVMRPGLTELEVAQAYEGIVGQVIPLLAPLVRDIWFVQLRRALEGEEVNATERAAGTALPGARQLTAAFADMVGFTHLGEVVPPEELARLVERFTDLAREVVSPPVRLVKTVGDAVMLVCPNPVKLLGAALELAEVAGRDAAIPRLRIGVASGWAVSRARDWFGSPVNVASRVTSVAEPGVVLVDGAARDAVGDAAGFTWSFVGAVRLKGVQGETKLFQVRRART